MSTQPAAPAAALIPVNAQILLPRMREYDGVYITGMEAAGGDALLLIGHMPTVEAVAAMDRYSREWLRYHDLLHEVDPGGPRPEPGTPEALQALAAQVGDRVEHLWMVVKACDEHGEWIGDRATQPTPGAFAVTVLSTDGLISYA